MGNVSRRWQKDAFRGRGSSSVNWLKAVPSVVDVIGFGEATLGRDESSIIFMEKPAFCLSFAKYLDRYKPLDESRTPVFL
ncbi:hypothetical protein HOLleu_21495 [Holothuria leucospilota]|uniref:Uncharacterized protein n=1 Tax=Holothuria leucospilota TaxID=206669 RepID=A0A9Q1BXD3_HOLLE|nr:hypothetical protein HOLleu_21495 [Holothuria leucospilota]